MKKIYLAVFLFATLMACEKENIPEAKVPDNGTDIEIPVDSSFVGILKSKQWQISNYQLDYCGDPGEGNEGPGPKVTWDPVNNKTCTALYGLIKPEQTEPYCEYCGAEGTWKSYKVTFSESSIEGQHSSDWKKEDREASDFDNCQVVYVNETLTTNYNTAWNYNEETNELEANFGHLYDYFGKDQPELFTFKYKVVSFTNEKIVLEGLMTSNNCEVVSRITLE